MKQLVWMLAMVTALAACGGKAKPRSEGQDLDTAETPADTRPLFERLGGQANINAVVHEFVETTSTDPRIKIYFANTDKVDLEKKMDEHICSITGGGCVYKGKEMKPAHLGMKVTTDAFEAFMDDLEKTLVKMNVPEREKGEVLGAFRGMQDDVVEVP